MDRQLLESLEDGAFGWEALGGAVKEERVAEDLLQAQPLLGLRLKHLIEEILWKGRGGEGGAERKQGYRHREAVSSGPSDRCVAEDRGTWLTI